MRSTTVRVLRRHLNLLKESLNPNKGQWNLHRKRIFSSRRWKYSERFRVDSNRKIIRKKQYPREKAGMMGL